MTTNERRPVGRPRGSSAQLDRVRERVAIGEDPLAAFAAEGYRYPTRALKQHVADIAEARGADEIRVLTDVVTLGNDSDALAAASAIFQHVDQSASDREHAQGGAVVTVVDVSTFDGEIGDEHALAGATVYDLPRDIVQAIHALRALMAGTRPISSELESPRQLATQRLKKIIGGAKSWGRATPKIRAAAELLKRGLASRRTDDAPRTIFALPPSPRETYSQLAEGGALFVDGGGVSCAVELLWQAEAHADDPEGVYWSGWWDRQVSAAQKAAKKKEKNK